MNHIKQSIFNYIKSESSYALLVDGEWGTGKTYYLNKKVIPEISKEESCYPIYVSLYGCETLVGVKRRINSSLLNNKGLRKVFTKSNSFFALGKKIANFFEGNIWLKSGFFVIEELINFSDETQLQKMTGTIILFIDDLERLSSNIKIEDLLGLISSEYIEKLNAKTVLIANTREIDDDAKRKFEKIKEKVIDKTLAFNPSVNYAVKEIFNSFNNSFINEYKEWLIEILEFYNETINLRTLNSILTTFVYFDNIFNENNINEKHAIKIRKSVFLNIMVLTNEAKEDKESKGIVLNSETVKELAFDSKYVDLVTSLDITNPIKNIKNNEEYKTKVGKVTISEQIKNKYHNKNQEFDTNIFYFNGVQDYVLHGYYDDELFEKSYKKWIYVFYSVKELDNYNSLSDFRKMSEAELKKRQIKIIESVEDNKFKFVDLLHIYNYFIQLKTIDLVLIGDNCNYDEKLVERLCYEYVHASREDVSRLENFAEIYKENEEIIQLVDKLKEFDIERYKTEYSKMLTRLFLGEQIDRISKSGNEVIFDVLAESELIDKYVLCVGSKADELEFFLRGQIFDKNKVSKEKTKEIIEKLQQPAILDDLDKIDNFKIKELVEQVKKYEG